ncbi:MAG: ribosome assembly RNA-binding protein YhbY [Desulfobacteraceae bacterium]|nr:MAG: ribosome assembly RNA-binding protein YhbY [Desulfobacteraceae bacterium]
MTELKGSQRKFLRGLAHNLNPAAYVGQKGITEQLIEEINQALDASELIKVKFVDYKDKDVKKALSDEITKAVNAHLAGMVGHVIILYRQHKDTAKRLIKLPK